jgi:hypothetical protein
MIGEGAERVGIECAIPLYVWRTHSFQSWYAALRAAGNRLDEARLKWVHSIKPNANSFVFYWALAVKIFIANENRVKSNEIVIARTHIASSVLYHRGDSIESSKIVLVKEFRSAVNNSKGYVYELPGGSVATAAQVDSLSLAIEELAEETGFHVDASERFVRVRRIVFILFPANNMFFFVQSD